MSTQTFVKIKNPRFFLLIGFFMTASLIAKDQDSIPIDTAKVFQTAGRKMAAYDAATKDKNLYPNDAKGATWTQVPRKDWVSGFYPGCLWYLYEYNREKNLPGAKKWKSLAEAWTAGLRDQQYNTNHHDTGFMIFDSYGNGYRLTTNPAYLPVITRTAQSLSSRFVPTSGLIRSWGKVGDTNNQTVIIDNMMNLELLLWASDHAGKTSQGGDLRRIAVSHADRAMDHFIRSDGSTYHVVEVNPLNGKVIRKHTKQGKGDETCWSRGEAWAIYGFGTMYQYTGKPKYLVASERAADYYISHLPADFVPPSDFDSTLNGLEFKDSSAAAVAASALIRLSQQVTDPAKKKKYFHAAENTLRSLTQAPYFAEGDAKASLLNHAARNYCEDPTNKMTDTGLIFGDYYLLEALLAYEHLKSSKTQSIRGTPTPKP